MATIIARVRLNPIYTSWQDRTNDIYLTPQAPEADILATMKLDYIKNAIRQSILEVVDGEIDLSTYTNDYSAHERILLDNTWTNNALIVGSVDNHINGIQIKDKVYEFKAPQSELSVYNKLQDLERTNANLLLEVAMLKQRVETQEAIISKAK